MSKAELRLASCQGKKSFGSPDVARRANRRIEGVARHVYRCGTCGNWHIGESSQHGDKVSVRLRKQRLREIEEQEAWQKDSD